MKGFTGIKGKLSQLIIKVVGHILHHPPLQRDCRLLLIFLWMLYANKRESSKNYLVKNLIMT